MVSYQQRIESGKAISRITELLRDTQGNPVVSIRREDLVELARHHPKIKTSGLVPQMHRKQGYWKTEQGRKEARNTIAQYRTENGKLPNTTGLSKIGLGGFMYSISVRTYHNPRLAYIRFLHGSGYSLEEIAGAGMNGFNSVALVKSALGMEE